MKTRRINVDDALHLQRLAALKGKQDRLRQQPPPFTVFTLLYWIVVACAVSTPLLGFLLYALGLLEFRR